MDFPQLINPFYKSFSAKADCETAINLYLERIESGNGRNPFAMYRSPGLGIFTTAQAPVTSEESAVPIRGMLELNGGLFDVRGHSIEQRDSTGAASAVLGPIDSDGLPVTMAANPATLFVVSAGILYAVYQGALQAVSTPFVPASVGFLQGYVICLADNGRQFFFSVDGLTWNALDYQTAEASANNLVNMLVDHQELWLFGNRITQVFALGSDPNAPFQQIQSAVITQGLAAKFAIGALDNSVFWLGESKNGDRIVWRANGYTPVRVSNHAVENALRIAVDVSDAIMWTYQLNGHSCLRLTLPSANDGLGDTWEYDVTTGAWTQPLYWNLQAGQYERHRGNCAVSAFGKILVGDYRNGLIYGMSPDFYYDFGYPLRWERRTPHLTADRKRIQYKRFDLFMQTGVALEEPLWLNDHSLSGSEFAAALQAATQRVTLLLFWNGILQSEGAGPSYDYELTGSSIETTLSVGSGDYFRAVFGTEDPAPFVETPDGAIPGSDFTLAGTPTTLLLFKNGLLQAAGGADYTLTGLDIAMTVPLVAGDRLQAFYYTDAVPPMTNVVPTGATPGVAFTIPSTPTSGTFLLFRSGVLQQEGSDYTLAGTIVVTTLPVAAGEAFRAVYWTDNPAPITVETPSGLTPGTSFTLTATPEAGGITAAQAAVLQLIYDYQPYVPLDPYPDPDTMNSMGFFPWGAQSELSDGTVIGDLPKVWMRYSDDGGNNWTNFSYRSLGGVGEYQQKMFWLRCAQGYDRVWEISGDGPVKTAIVQAAFDGELCQS